MAPHGDSEGTGDSKTVKRSCLRKQLRKTKMCQHYERGECHFGADCAFAHSPDEMQSAPDLRKTRLCEAFMEGRCSVTDCSFAHGEAELRSTDLFFKKTLCIWNEKGKCRAGDQCRFAHGHAELRAANPAAEGTPSAGSKGHPGSCAMPCKYHWKKKGCKDGASCGSCHLCPFSQDPATRGRRKRTRNSSEDSRAPSPRKQRRGDANRLDEYGNSRPSWLHDDGSARSPWGPAPAALPGYGAAYGVAPAAWGYHPAGGYLPAVPAAGYPAAAAWGHPHAEAAYRGSYHGR